MSDQESPKKKKKKSSSSSHGFQSLNLSPEIFQGIQKIGFRIPTPVQRKSLPLCLSGVDCVVMARTGSGKTAAFAIPVIEKVLKRKSGGGISGVILSPTRELALQTFKVVKTLAQFTDIETISILGGDNMEKQFGLLAENPDIILATPGRLHHHLSEIPDFSLKDVSILVFDEADRLFEMGFSEQIRGICRDISPECQKLLFSATLPSQLAEFARAGLQDPVFVRTDAANVSPDLRMAFMVVRSLERDALLLFLIQNLYREEGSHNKKTLIFAATRHHVEYIHQLLRAAIHSISVETAYGTMDPEARRLALRKFRKGLSSVLVVTDVAARGIDIPQMDFVVHYHFASTSKLFVHRSGRAARAGHIGWCFAFCTPEELPYMMDLHLFLGREVVSSEKLYGLEEMTPEGVHFGSAPESILEMENENVRRILSLHSDLQSLQKVCDNGMKQYKRSRTDASKEGVRRAKELVSTQYSDSIPPHPLLLHWSRGIFGDASQEREEFLKQMRSFRPKETVFEAFSTNLTSPGVVSQVDKGKTTSSVSSSNKNQIAGSTTLTVMKNMRRQMSLVRDKDTALVVAGSDTAKLLNGELSSDQDPQPNPKETLGTTAPSPTTITTAITHKKPLSKAERKRRKKPGTTPIPSHSTPIPSDTTQNTKDYRDHHHFISTEIDPHSQLVENSLLPSSSSSKSSYLLDLQRAQMDLVGDENEDLLKKQRLKKWDPSKRKYVQTTVGEEMEGKFKNKKAKIQLENGVKMKASKMKLGEMYEKWQKKTSRSIGRSGVFDDDVAPSSAADPPKNLNAIKKSRKKTQDNKIKNMPKANRKKLMAKQRKMRDERSGKGMPGYQGKKGFSGRWGKK